MRGLGRTKIAVIGLGYVGLPLAVEFGKKYSTIGFDIDPRRIRELRLGRDSTLESSAQELASARKLKFSADPQKLSGCRVFIVTVPTPIDRYKRPDLRPLISASQTIGKILQKGAVVIYESTVFPGCTEEVCVPVLERESGLRFNRDFYCGYSPERINPGDREHRLPTIRKITSGSTPQTADLVDALYSSIVTAGTHRARSIRVAEAAKVIENTQRDLNIALMNELSAICHALGIDTGDVLAAARTKWNFLPFAPGLVGGHCVGVDPYYLTHRAEKAGYHPEVILAGRRINDLVGERVGRECVRRLLRNGHNVERVTVLGLTFKENVPDIRNSKAVDIVRELSSFGLTVQVHDPFAAPEDALHEYEIKLTEDAALTPADAVVLAVPHEPYVAQGWHLIERLLKNGSGLVMDVKARLDRAAKPPGIELWRL